MLRNLIAIVLCLCVYGCEYVPPTTDVPGALGVIDQVAFVVDGPCVGQWTWSDSRTTITSDRYTRSVSSTITVKCAVPQGCVVVGWDGVESYVECTATVKPYDGLQMVVAHVVRVGGG